MQKLSEALKATNLTAEPSDRSKDLSSTPAHGLTTEGGKITTQSTSHQISQGDSNTKRQQSEECLGQKTPISNSPEDKKKLTLLVKSCYEALNTYGKSPDNMEASVMLMQMMLGKFPYEQVRSAFETYLNTNSEMPKPADIIAIIEPERQKKKWCSTTFIDIKKRGREGQFITEAEKKYCEDFVAAKVSGDEEVALLIEAAEREVELQDSRYWLEG